MEPTPDQRLAALAERQRAVITAADAFACGLTRDQLARRVTARRLIPHARSVYLVAGAPPTWQQYAYAAVRAAPSGAVVSHLTSAAMDALYDPPLLPHITVPPTASARLRVARVHRAALTAEDVTIVGGIARTTCARTLVDCAGLLPINRLADMVDTALCREITSPHEVHAAMARATRGPGRLGTARLRQVLEVWTPGPLPGSPAEMRLIRRLVEWGYPMPARQHEVRGPAGFRALMDISWPERLVGVEYDGAEAHGPRQRPADRHREEQLRLLGWEIVRARKGDVRANSTTFRARLDRALARPAA